MTAVLIIHSTSPSIGAKIGLLCFAPAFVEFIIARGERNRPWVWLIATPTLYGTAKWWASPVRSGTDWIASFISKTFDIFSLIKTEVMELAAVLAVVLLSRAVVGSFIGSRKRPDPAANTGSAIASSPTGAY